MYDLSGVVNKRVSVYFNKQKINITDFKDYCGYYLKGMTQKDDTEEGVKVAYMSNERWEVMVGASEGEFHQVSFVNSICTIRGGTHVEYIVSQVCDGLINEAQKKVKKIKIKNHFIKSNIFILVNCLIENPAFDSQTKETLITKPNSFGSSIELSEKFFKDLLKTGVIDQIIFQAQSREDLKLQKHLKGVKKSRLLGVNKLEDANKAGTKDSLKCTLILTEGDSAKALAMNGIEVIGRDYYGVFPLRGKFLNVREAANDTILKNQEVSHIIEIVGLSVGKKYNGDLSSLRYGSIMIMTDQDNDGSHIKGLIINFIHHFWPDLIRSNTFLKEFVTPILKAIKGNSVHSFFTLNDFKTWATERMDDLKGWRIKYYKGLGTSDDKEAKEYFQNIQKHEIRFQYDDGKDDEAVDLAFNKKKADDRKEWLNHYDPNNFVDHNVKVLTYFDFIHKELIQFSIANNQRAIPSLCDGLKTGQRKILFSCFKRKLTKEIKVAQLSGYVAEHSEYHHGEANLQDTIIGMAQGFVGSNNINLLLPNGQFGTRAMGGKDAASGRYLHTALNPATRFIFPEADDHVLNYIEEDAKLVEPVWYLPVIPMVLVNGCDGIGTGWSTNIPNYCPRQIIENLRRKLDGGEFERMNPYYKGFTGEIEPNGDKNFTMKGRYEFIKEEYTLEITELPVKKWTRDYKSMIEQIMIDKNERGILIDDMREYHTTRNVHFKLFLPEGHREPEEADIEKQFKLSGNISCTNMVLFDSNNKIRRFGTELEILEEFYHIRLKYYELRKSYLMSRIEREVKILDNKMRFIQDVNDGRIIISKRNKKNIVGQLISLNYTKKSNLPRIKSSIEDNIVAKLQKEEVEEGQEEREGEEIEERLTIEDREQANVDRDGKEFDYLLSMALWSLSLEQIEKLRKELESKKVSYDTLKNTDEKDMWRSDLVSLSEVLNKIESDELKQIEKDDQKLAKSMKMDQGAKHKKKKKQTHHDEDDNQIKKLNKSKIDDEKKPAVKIKGSKDGALKRPDKTNNSKEESNGAASSSALKIPKINEPTIQELEKRLSQSSLRFFASDEEKRKRVLEIMKMTLKDFEKRDRFSMSLEERTYFEELKKKAEVDQVSDGEEKKMKLQQTVTGASSGPISRSEAHKISSERMKIAFRGEDSDSDYEDAVMEIMKSKQRRSRIQFDEDSDS